MYTVAQLAHLVNGKVIGNAEFPITGFAPAENAKEGEITFLAFPKYLPQVQASRASCVIVSAVVENLQAIQIVVTNPYYAFTLVVNQFEGMSLPSPGISPKSEILKGVTIGENPSIAPFVFIDEGVRLGNRVILFPGVSIGKKVVIGDDALIYSNVSIRDKTRIGNRVTIHDGAVIGSDGFGYVTLEGIHKKIPQVGIAVIEDDVSIGAGVTIDRAALGETRIKEGTKLDDQVHVGHNVTIGAHGLFAAQTGISGSVKIGDYAVTGGQTGFSGHLKVGNHVKMAGKSGITHDIEDNQTIAGFPAVPHLEWKRSVILLNQLSKIQKQVKVLEKRIVELEEKIKEPS
ncbi:MAG: UDP-3-O-(3-hydroxymyristoyl)glucosamine N-acyltransferase [Nitrospirae bacterium]|nr:UDP-3-O-(3-hydroxymyristoyl)glucosamine N-acyltransferase [Nitrospirota bacterium]MBI3594600.1 UDP-3-O-(3-hydroxymyristoyl)glucosamine N-acyltransferase [Nitrospirota bacterium]